ncbi:hypothetical protein [Clostridium tertium]|uniref:hypothetical protein n=1 Tax=Clostridium tertium TaxID=1559 RepID=UPI0024B32E7C|nr:hypothetical protein [Clostridium tertium]MDI9218153.1 hypothetical protein [Clostridium tertium]
MEYKIYTEVCDIIDYIYKEKKEEYKKFYIKIIPKEMKSIHGRYIWNRRLTEYKKEFYDVFYGLIIGALELGIIYKQDIITEIDSADKDRLEKYFGSIRNCKVKKSD